MAGLSLSGLASGVDTSSIVEQLMAIERQSLTKIGYRRAAVTGQQAALKEVASKLSALKDAALALNADSTWTQKQTVESSDPTRLGVTMLAGAGIGGQSISVDRLASSAQRRFTIATDASGKTTGAEQLTLYYGTDADAAGNAKVTIDIADGSTKQQIADAINAKTGGPAVAAVVNGPDGEHLVMSARKTGEDSDFTVTTTSGGTVVAEDAVFEANRPTGDLLQAAYRIGAGAQQKWHSNVIEHAIPGVRVTLKGVTTSPATVTVTEPALDRDAIKAKVKSFVDAYNAVIDTTRSKLTEQRTRNPTSDFQAARGQLYGDAGLTGMLSRLRQDMADVVTADGINDLSDLGITIPKATAGAVSADAKAGKLVLDEAKLTAALDQDFTAVKSFLGTFSKDVETFVKAQTGGSGILDDRIAGGDRTAKRVQDQIDRATERLDAREKRLKAQFTAMEIALQNSQTQGAWLSGQIAGLNANKG
jgi:flagellar hook-associated protein 2